VKTILVFLFWLILLWVAVRLLFLAVADYPRVEKKSRWQDCLDLVSGAIWCVWIAWEIWR
jgi:hypothetical protein